MYSFLCKIRFIYFFLLNYLLGKYIPMNDHAYYHVHDMRELGRYIHIPFPYMGGYGPYFHIPNPYLHDPDSRL